MSIFIFGIFFDFSLRCSFSSSFRAFSGSSSAIIRSLAARRRSPRRF
ncbi:unnamed protein product [Schistosoma mattheei]|uniref:Uncharacterized protein n=2 Tax=Schistosoma TaxID=6181 RepID=A0A3P7XMC1_9TREM|nr:unnamed protein product [Schistosoma margrebowiei]VDP84785.1 unnamed protein product [Schistosoma mattheei]